MRQSPNEDLSEAGRLLCSGEIGDARANLLLQQLQAPARLGRIVRVLANGEQGPEPTNGLVESADSGGAPLRVAHDPQVFHHVVNVHCLVGHGRVYLGTLQVAGRLTIGELVLDIVPAQQLSGFFLTFLGVSAT